MIYLAMFIGWLVVLALLFHQFGFRKVWAVCAVITIINIILSWLIVWLK